MSGSTYTAREMRILRARMDKVIRENPETVSTFDGNLCNHLSALEVRDRGGVFPSTLTRWTDRGLVPAVKLPRGALYHPLVVNAMLEWAEDMSNARNMDAVELARRG